MGKLSNFSVPQFLISKVELMGTVTGELIGELTVNKTLNGSWHAIRILQMFVLVKFFKMFLQQSYNYFNFTGAKTGMERLSDSPEATGTLTGGIKSRIGIWQTRKSLLAAAMLNCLPGPAWWGVCFLEGL